MAFPSLQYQYEYQYQTQVGFAQDHFYWYPSPSNINYFWNLGFLSAMCLAIQIATGIFLCFYYSNDTLLSFASVEYMMREVAYGWFFRYAHANGASFFFIVVYAHMFRGLYFQSYRYPRFGLWTTGVLIFLLLMGTAFLGYVLPWGQMSFWGATVISNFLGGIPVFGKSLLIWLWGGFSIDNATLHRIFTLHFLLPMVVAGITFAHFYFLHLSGSSNPLNLDQIKEPLPLHPYFWVKDLYGLLIFLFVYLAVVFFAPNALGHPDNYIQANSAVTPPHIVPEWYFLPFYAILRSIPNKNLGILLMLAAIVFLLLLMVGANWHVSKHATYVFPLFSTLFWHFLFNFLYLGWIGSMPASPPYVGLGAVATFSYFATLAFFVVIDRVHLWLLTSGRH